MTDSIDSALARPANRALRLLAYRAQGRPITEMAVEWAKTEIHAGAEGASLAMLAGLWGQLDAIEVEDLFEKAIVEVGVGASETDYVLDYARLICECIVESKLRWEVALEELITLAGPPPWDARFNYWYLFSDDVIGVTEFGDRPALYPNMTKANIGECLRQEAALFLKNHGRTTDEGASLGDSILDALVQAAPPSRTANSDTIEAPGSSRGHTLLGYAGLVGAIFLLGWLTWLIIQKVLNPAS